MTHSLSDWRIDSWNRAVPGAAAHWSAINLKTGKRIEAESRRELYAAIAAIQKGTTDGE